MSDQPDPQLRAKLRTALIHWLWTYEETLSPVELDSDDYDVFEQAVKVLGCEFAGHQPEADQCNIPDHDYCLWCGVSTPGEAKRAKAVG